MALLRDLMHIAATSPLLEALGCEKHLLFLRIADYAVNECGSRDGSVILDNPRADALRFHVSEQTLAEALIDYVELGLMASNGDEYTFILPKRRYASDSAEATRERKRRQREREKPTVTTCHESVTSGHDMSRIVTSGHDMSRIVTSESRGCHELSRASHEDVTNCHERVTSEVVVTPANAGLERSGATSAPAPAHAPTHTRAHAREEVSNSVSDQDPGKREDQEEEEIISSQAITSHTYAHADAPAREETLSPPPPDFSLSDLQEALGFQIARSDANVLWRTYASKLAAKDRTFLAEAINYRDKRKAADLSLGVSSFKGFLDQALRDFTPKSAAAKQPAYQPQGKGFVLAGQVTPRPQIPYNTEPPEITREPLSPRALALATQTRDKYVRNQAWRDQMNANAERQRSVALEMGA